MRTSDLLSVKFQQNTHTDVLLCTKNTLSWYQAKKTLSPLILSLVNQRMVQLRVNCINGPLPNDPDFFAGFIQGYTHIGGSRNHALFAWLINHQPAVLFSQNKPATSNQPAVLFSQKKPAPAISHQPTEQARGALPYNNDLT
jgi:hypothetical protein